VQAPRWAAESSWGTPGGAGQYWGGPPKEQTGAGDCRVSPTLSPHRGPILPRMLSPTEPAMQALSPQHPRRGALCPPHVVGAAGTRLCHAWGQLWIKGSAPPSPPSQTALTGRGQCPAWGLGGSLPPRGSLPPSPPPALQSTAQRPGPHHAQPLCGSRAQILPTHPGLGQARTGTRPWGLPASLGAVPWGPHPSRVPPGTMKG